MAQTSRFLRALQRIVDTARKINPNPHPTPATQATPNVLTSLPEHKPLLPLLLSHDVPRKLARTCAERYDEYAIQLKSETESRLAPYLVNRRESQPAQVYSIFLNNYNQTLQRWSQSILNTALKSLKRDSVELRNWEVTYPAPLWLPVRLPCTRMFWSHVDNFLAAARSGICVQKIGCKGISSVLNLSANCLIERLLPFIHDRTCPCVSDNVPSSASPSFWSLPS